jgi:hypothetical protein
MQEGGFRDWKEIEARATSIARELQTAKTNDAANRIPA